MLVNSLTVYLAHPYDYIYFNTEGLKKKKNAAVRSGRHRSFNIMLEDRTSFELFGEEIKRSRMSFSKLQ